VIDDHSLVVAIDIAVMIVTVLDHHGVVAITMVFLANDATIAIPIAIAMAFTNGHADRANANTNFFRARRHGETNSGNGDRYHCKTLDHGMFLQVVNFTFVNYR
jgi:hypothetical protein